MSSLTCTGVWERIAATVPDAEAIAHGHVTRTWGEFDDRSAQLAAHLAAAGLGPGSSVGLFLYNAPEYLEAHYAALKVRGVPVNLNYRYRERELSYVLADAECEAVVFHSSLGERIEAVAASMRGVRTWIEVADDGNTVAGRRDGVVGYEDAIAGHRPMAPGVRHDDDVYMLYTGGTTGAPKGVQYRLGSMSRFFVQASATRAGMPIPDSVEAAAALAAELHRTGDAPRTIPCCPLMHGTGIWIGAMGPHLLGGAVILTPSGRFDAHEVWTAAVEHQADSLVIVGDVFALPLLDELDVAAAEGRPYDVSGVTTITSSGAMLSAESKARLIDRMPQLTIRDVLGSTEGAMGSMVTTASSAGAPTASFVPNPNVVVLDEHDQPVQPGSGVVGVLASSGGNVPIGYRNDADKSAQTFRDVRGVRHAIHGDMATVDADGSITLLGRGSHCINTGGEKVYPEEVEEVIKSHPDVRDALVFGVADERFGQRVVAVTSVSRGGSTDGGRTSDDDLERRVIAHVRAELSSYKAPKQVVVIDDVPRLPNGKADYRTARRVSGLDGDRR